MDKTIVRLRTKIRKAQEEINAFQEACPHPPQNVRYQHGANTGNWCSDEDSYWTDYYCGKCGKWWMEDGSTRVEGAFCVPYGDDLLPKEESK